MTKLELYEKLGGIYGGQKELIDDVLNDFNNLKKQNDTLMSALMITRQKYNNDKARYRRKAKMYRDRINEGKEYIKYWWDIRGNQKMDNHIQDLLRILNGDNNE